MQAGPVVERRIALVPRVHFGSGRGGASGEYALYLTSERSIFVQELAPEKPSLLDVNHAMAIGAMWDQAMKPLEVPDYSVASPAALAARPGSITLWHATLHRVEVYWLVTTLQFQVYLTDRRAAFDASFLAEPPYGLKQREKAAGRSPGAAKKKYYRDAQEAVRRALPPAVAARSKWAKLG